MAKITPPPIACIGGTWQRLDLARHSFSPIEPPNKPKVRVDVERRQLKLNKNRKGR